MNRTMTDQVSQDLIVTDCWRVGFPAVLMATVRTNCGLYSGVLTHRQGCDSPPGGWEGTVELRHSLSTGILTEDQRLRLSLQCQPVPHLPCPLMCLQIGNETRSAPITPRVWIYPHPETNVALCFTYCVPPSPEIPSREPLIIIVTDSTDAGHALHDAPTQQRRINPRPDQTITRCECSEPGFCPRHRCDKTPQWRRLCQTRPDYFQLWEHGGGPGQYSNEPLTPRTPAEPGLLEKAWNLATATAAFVADGCHTVDKSEYAARLAVCDTCDQRQDNWCLACGCNLAFKAHGRAMQCPLGKWAAVPTATGPPESNQPPAPLEPPKPNCDPPTLTRSASEDVPPKLTRIPDPCS